jgi:hypothetical protein
MAIEHPDSVRADDIGLLLCQRERQSLIHVLHDPVLRISIAMDAGEGGSCKQGDKHPYGKSLSFHHIRIQSYTFFGKRQNILEQSNSNKTRSGGLLILVAEDY